MNNYRIKNTKGSRKATRNKLLIGFGVIFFSALIIGGLYKANILTLPWLHKKTPSSNGTGINYGPPTKQEKEETQAHKDSLGQNDNSGTTAPPSSGQKKSVTPVISSWGQNLQTQDVEISGYVAGVFEEGGTCTATLSKDNQKVSESKQATINAQNVSCGFISISRSKLSAGNWIVTLAYSSGSAQGNSQNQTLEVK